MKIAWAVLMLVCSVGALQQKQTVESGAKTDREKRLDEQREAGTRAIEEARQRVADNPESAEAYFNLAETLLKGPIRAEDYAKVQEAYLKAVELNPSYAEAYFGLGIFYANHDKYEKGYKALEKAISLKPDYAEAYCALGFAYIQKKFGGGTKLPRTKEGSKAAIKAFNEAIRIRPDLGMAYDGLGEACLYLEQYEQALEAFKQAAALNPNDVMAHVGVGTAHISLGNRDGAMQEYETLKQIAAQTSATYKEKGLESFPNLAESYGDHLLKQIKERFPDR